VSDYFVLLWRLLWVTGAVSTPLWGGLWLAWDAKGRPCGRFRAWLWGA
jgi:hypothetical protein